MPNQSIGYNNSSTLNGFALASKGVSLQDTTSGEQNTRENPKIETLRYPYNLKIDRDTDYLDIKISKYEPPGLTIGKPGTNEFRNFPVFESFKKGDNETPEAFQGRINKEVAGKLAGGVALSTGSSKNTFERPHTYICLPIPQSISDSISVSWGPDALDPLAAFGTGLTAAALDTKTSAKAIIEGLALAAPKALKGQTQAIIAAVSGAAYGALGGNVSATSLISRASGQVLNPNLELLFNGVELRSFPFTFEFISRNKIEAQTIKKIIRSLKKSMTAKSSSTTDGLGIFIGAPDVFQLSYRRGKSPHPFLNKFKPMALTNMQLNYTASNTYATYADGTPIHIQMSLTFTELNPVYSEDYNDDGIGVGF